MQPAIRAAVFFLLTTTWALGTQEPRRSLKASRVETPPCMDARSEEALWDRAELLGDFAQQWPEWGAPSKKRTEVRVLYDDRFLYVRARMHHEPGRADIIRQVHRRDQSSASDWFAVFIDSAHDHRTAYSFMVNASNVQRDGVHGENREDDWSWDGVWESAVSVDADGWTALLKIPLSLLRFHNGDGPLVWGVNFGRRDEGREREISYWDVPPRDADASISRYPHLTGLEGLKPRPRREWIPYLSTQRKFETAQGYDDRGWTNRAGLDAHLGLNTYSQLDLSVRPDFGQVEVDQAVLNLGTVETFFPEKRPFFLEGTEIFQTPGVRLFYSRRIGRGLDAPEPSEDQRIVDRPMAVEIAAAAKFTTKLPSGLAIGVLAANMEGARATLQTNAGVREERVVSPSTLAGVVRVTQSLGDLGSYVGTFGSFLHQTGPDGRVGKVAAMDGAWKTRDRSSTVEGIYAHSDAGFPDAMLGGDLFKVHAVSNWGKGWSIDGNAFYVTRMFNPNDLGYLDRPDRKGFTFDLDHRWDLKRGIFQNPFWRFTLCEFEDLEGRPYLRYAESWGKVEFANSWDIFAGAGIQAPVDDDRELRSYSDPMQRHPAAIVKKYLRIPTGQWAFWGFDSPASRAWCVNVQWNHAWREGGTKEEVGLVNTFKPTPSLEVKLESQYVHARGEWHWLETQGDTPIVGMRKLSQLDQVLRVAYAVSPALSLQAFSQWLAGNWNFRDLRTWAGDGRLEPGATTKSPLAYSDRLWNLNFIARWEFRPGSAVYLVYTHGAWTDALINERGTLSPGRDLALMQHLPSDDVVQVKLSWMFK